MTDRASGAIFKVGDVLNNTYRIETVLGRGGTSEVYRARSEISGQLAALKALRPEFSQNADLVTLMTREEAIREVRHDAIVRYYHNQRTGDGIVFLVMDYVQGVGLHQRLADGGMRAEDLLTVALRVTEGLQVAHARNITHRDLSPDNIILRNGDPADPVIIDFGIAKDSSPGAETIVGTDFAGKYAYAAPEQLAGQADARSDIYALGALLLATFRGQVPEVGGNPSEVIARKALPLDTTGVPEPLKTAIDRMTTPDPDLRVQDTGALLHLLRGAAPVTGDFSADETRLAPAPVPQPRPAPPPPTPGPRPAARKRRGELAAVLALLILAGAGGAVYVAGLFGPGIPVADPFTLRFAHGGDGPAEAAGFVPSAALSEALTAHVQSLGGTAKLTVARGAVTADWGADVARLIDLVAPLDEARVSITETRAEVTGLTEDRALYDDLSARLAQPGLFGALQVSAALQLGPRFLPPDRVLAVADNLADCGDLALRAPPPVAYGLTDDITLLGRVAAPETRAALRDGVQAIAGNREVRIETEVLNPTLCAIDAVLPDAPAAGFAIAFADGATGADNPTGRFFVGENPVIDVTIPADVTSGFLMVSALDVSGNVFQLLPNLNRPDHRVEDLRAGRTGPVSLRVAYSLAEAEAAGGTLLALLVDDTALGKSRIMVLHSDTDILDGLRPTTESAESFAKALARRSGAVQTLDSRILTTARR